MAYSNKNLLIKIVDIQNFVLEQTKRGITQEYVYNKHIYPAYRISRATFYNYLARNAKRELKEIIQAESQEVNND